MMQTLWITSARTQKAAVGSQVPYDSDATPRPQTSETPLVSSSASNGIVAQDNDDVNKRNYGNALLDVVSPDSRTLLDGLTPVSEKLPISDDKKVQAETVDNKKTEDEKDDYVIEFEREMEEAQIYINLCVLIINRKNFIFL